MKKINLILITILTCVFSFISVSAMEGIAPNTNNNNDEAKIVINNTIDNSNIPLLANIYARNIQSLNGQWHYLIDQQEMGYYNYRMQVLKDGFLRISILHSVDWWSMILI